ncbi:MULTISPECIES: type I-E CRISPR-associated protein Cas6/Cse3/CasE [unclassified Streptomyces]|uniref:Type I-E CRISPR-associated protein Cas6/Cse3/CasE n=1 Tax=Streptomyces sp. NBC_00060 TaxID=2975636 RepID=A0AAU2HEQ0_9ACTN
MTPTAPPATTQAWLTHISLNPASRAVQYDLAHADALHRRVMTLLPHHLGASPRAHAGLLFRLDTDAAPTLLVQSRIAPDASRLPHGYGHTQVREMHALFSALRPGLSVCYRILGNTVRRCGRNSTAGRFKQAIALHGDDAAQWWSERATAAGLTLNTLLAEPAETLTTRHPQNTTPHPSRPTAPLPATTAPPPHKVVVPHQATLFQGTATIHDPQTAQEALLHGIGRSKSYGCGLLSLAPHHPHG